jgi:hypothetical protein
MRILAPIGNRFVLRAILALAIAGGLLAGFDSGSEPDLSLSTATTPASTPSSSSRPANWGPGNPEWERRQENFRNCFSDHTNWDRQFRSTFGSRYGGTWFTWSGEFPTLHIRITDVTEEDRQKVAEITGSRYVVVEDARWDLLTLERWKSTVAGCVQNQGYEFRSVDADEVANVVRLVLPNPPDSVREDSVRECARRNGIPDDALVIMYTDNGRVILD